MKHIWNKFNDRDGASICKNCNLIANYSINGYYSLYYKDLINGTETIDSSTYANSKYSNCGVILKSRLENIQNLNIII